MHIALPINSCYTLENFKNFKVFELLRVNDIFSVHFLSWFNLLLRSFGHPGSTLLVQKGQGKVTKFYQTIELNLNTKTEYFILV